MSPATLIWESFALTSTSAPNMEESRKWGIYNTTNLLFKTYFKVRLPFGTEVGSLTSCRSTLSVSRKTFCALSMHSHTNYPNWTNFQSLISSHSNTMWALYISWMRITQRYVTERDSHFHALMLSTGGAAFGRGLETVPSRCP